LIAPLSDLHILSEDAIHGSLRGEVAVLVEEVRRPRPVPGRRSGLVQDIEHGTPFRDGERPNRIGRDGGVLASRRR